MAEPVEMIKLVRELFDYDYERGCLIYKKGRCKGKDARGYVVTKGYRQLDIRGKAYMAHRLIWIWCKQVIPEGQIDHKFQDKTDTRIESMRDVTQQWNMQNRPKPLANNKSSGVLGVHRWRKRWVAHIRTGGKKGKLINLGVYDTIAEASAAYLLAKKSLHPGSVL